MANLTLSIDEELLKRARVKAAEQGTSVNAVVRDRLSEFADDGVMERQRRAGRRLIELSDRVRSGSGPGGRKWTREELYEERIPRYLREKSRRS